MLVTTSVAASLLVNPNRLRKSVLFVNEDATDSVYLKFEKNSALTVSATDHDVRLSPGASFSLNSTLDGVEQIQGRWTVIASANTPVVSILETEEARR